MPTLSTFNIPFQNFIILSLVITFCHLSDLQTPLTVAAGNGHLRCIKLLLMYKCDLYRTVSIDGQDVYAWDLATRNGHSGVARYLQGYVGECWKVAVGEEI